MTAGFIGSRIVTTAGEDGTVTNQSGSNAAITNAGGVWNLREIPLRAWPHFPNPAPGKPTNLTATAGDAQAALSWTAPVYTGSSAIAGYRINYGTGVAWYYINNTIVNTGSTSTTHTITGLTNGTTHAFTVAAINADGHVGDYATPHATFTPQVAGITPNTDNKARFYLHSTATSVEITGFSLAIASKTVIGPDSDSEVQTKISKESR